MTDDVADETTDPIEPSAAEPEAVAARGLLRPRSFVVGAVLAVAVAAGGYVWVSTVKPTLDAKRDHGSVTYEVPEAQQLTARAGETVYRIDPTESSLTYEIEEQFAGKDTSTATGVTNGIAGDIALNGDDLAASRIGEIVADVEQFHSDNNLRDARIRQDYLESATYPLARFTLTGIDGLDGTLVEGKTYDFTIEGAVTLREQTVDTTFEATAKLVDGRLAATATTTAKLSDFGAGPIRVAGLVSTADDVDLTLALRAFDPDEHAIPTTITGPDAKVPDDAPSFADTVQPILEANCVSCHGAGQMGAAHMEIDTAGDAQKYSDGLKTVTETGYMPPWPASDQGVPLAHEMKLTDDEIAAIGAWADAGGALDVAPDTELVAPEGAGGPQPRHDLELERPAYTGSTDNVNDYRCFVLDPEITEPTYLTGYEFIVDEPSVLHHAQVFQITGEQKASAATKDGADGKPGWSCYGGPNLAGARPPKVPGRGPTRDAGFFSGQPNLVAGWVPGQSAVIFPQDSGILLQPGDALVLQIHYHYGHEALSDRSSLAVQLDPGDEDRPLLRVINPMGPVEIPCAPEDQDEPLCDRDAAIADNVRLYGRPGASNEAGLLLLCGTTPEEMTADFDGRHATSTCDQVVPEDGTIVAVLGHMHTIGDSFRLTLDPDTADEQVLLDIPQWSFDWQMNYDLAEPIHVEAGDPIRLDCSWDRDADPLRDPKYIVFAEGTEDEMCFATYALIPDDQ